MIDLEKKSTAAGKHLITETLEFLKHINKTTDDINWVGSEDGKYSCSWNQFFIKFAHVVYDDDNGRVNVARDLIIVFKDNTWIERHNIDYTDIEFWSYVRPPVRQEGSQEFNEVICFYDTNISRCNLSVR